MPTTTSRISQISLVCVTATDQDRSIEFYTGALGFEKRVDTPFGGRYRWVEVYPPNGTTGIALAPPPEGTDGEPTNTGIALAPPPEGTDGEPTNTGIALTTDDIAATHAALRDSGVDVDAEVAYMGDPVPPMFWFRDPDGHTLMVVEQPD